MQRSNRIVSEANQGTRVRAQPMMEMMKRKIQAKESTQPIWLERRWPVAVAIIAVVAVLALLPERVRLFPAWVPYVAGIVLIVAMVPGALAPATRRRWLRVEHTIMLLFCAIAEGGILGTLAQVIGRMVFHSSEISGLQLLTSSIAVWVLNILTFSLLYWQIDRGGPEARLNDWGKRPDWLFPQTGVPDQAPPDWRPTFVDYQYLAFTTATAFSTTDVAPLTSRAKMMMLFESAVSLVTLLVVASRAINILGS